MKTREIEFEFGVGGQKLDDEVRLTGLTKLEDSSKHKGLQYFTAYFEKLLVGKGHINFYVRDGVAQMTFKSPEQMAQVLGGKNVVNQIDIVRLEIEPAILEGYNNGQPVTSVTVAKLTSWSDEKALRVANPDLRLKDHSAAVEVPNIEEDGEQLPTTNGVPFVGQAAKEA